MLVTIIVRLGFTRACGSSLLASLLLCCFYAAAQAQSGVGKNIDEVTKLAMKEGKVRMASSFQPDEEDLVLKAFKQKYPMIKVEHTLQIGGTDTRQRILTEAIGGVVEYDLVDVVAEMRKEYLKSGVLAGPFNWRQLFPKVAEIHFSPDGYFAGVAYGFHVFAYNPTLVPPERVP